MNDVLRIARLKIALQRAFLGRAILRVIMEETRGRGNISIWYFAFFKSLALGRSARGIAHVHCTDGVKLQKGWQWKKHGAKAIFQSDRIEMPRLLQNHALAITIDCVCQDYCSEVAFRLEFCWVRVHVCLSGVGGWDVVELQPDQKWKYQLSQAK